MHGASDDSVMLSLRSLRWMIETLRARYPGLPVRVGPSTIAVRRSPLGRQPTSDGTRRIALAANDPHCGALFGAAWTLGYVAEFARAGTQSLTLMGLQGPSGVIAAGAGEYVVRRPSYFVLARLGMPARVRELSISDPGRVTALALERDGGDEMLVANLTREGIEASIAPWPTSAAWRLDAASDTGCWSTASRRRSSSGLLAAST